MNITEVKSERSEREGLRSEFRQILLELAASTNPGVRNQSVRRLETLYHKKQFRHFYSDVFSVLREVKESPKKGSIDFLGDNVASLWEDYQPKNKDESGQLIDISENLQKLYDHVSLDLARIAYSDSGDSEVSGKTAISDINMRITELNNKEKNSSTCRQCPEGLCHSVRYFCCDCFGIYGWNRLFILGFAESSQSWNI